MNPTTNARAWARFETMLAAIHAGDAITVETAARETGVALASAERVFDALARAHLFEPCGHQLVRVSVVQSVGPP